MFEQIFGPPYDLILFVVIIVLSSGVHEFAHAWVAYKRGDDTAKELGRVTLNPIVHIGLIESIVLPALLYFGSGGTMIFGGAKPVPVNPNNLYKPHRDMCLVAIAGPISNFILVFIALFGMIGMKVVFPAYKCAVTEHGTISHYKPGRCTVPLCRYSLEKQVDTKVAAIIYVCPKKCEGNRGYKEDGYCPKCETENVKKFHIKTALFRLLRMTFLVNVLLGLFNLIVPIPPLDGSRVVRYFIPPLRPLFNLLDFVGIFILILLLWKVTVLRIWVFETINTALRILWSIYEKF